MPYIRSREQTWRALAHEQSDHVPFDSVGSTSSREVAGLVESMALPPDARACYLEGDFRYVAFEGREDRERYEAYLPNLPEEATLSDWGVGSIPLKTAEGYHAGHFDYRPLARVDSVGELERFPFPDLAERWRHEDLEERVRSAKTEGYVVVGQMSQTVLETAYCMRGMEQLFADLYERPGYVELLFEKIAERRRFQAKRFAEAGVDVLRIGDDIATQVGLLVGPALYRERLKPFHASVIAAARGVNASLHVLYHSDGRLTDLLPELLDVGVTAINPVQPECMDLRAVKREFGRDLVLWGGCPVQSTYAFGARADIVEHVRLLTEELSTDGGLVVQFYNMILTPRVTENLKTFFETFGPGARPRS